MEALNAAQLAWLRAVERKTGKKIDIQTAEDVRILARMNIQTFASETLAEENEE